MWFLWVCLRWLRALKFVGSVGVGRFSSRWFFVERVLICSRSWREWEICEKRLRFR